MPRAAKLGAVAGVVGLLAFVEFTSGVIQGYYTPLLTDIARHLSVPDPDVNWLEGAQLAVAALVIPALAKLGDMYGHRRILLISTAVTAVASVGLAFTDQFGVFIVIWAIQGFYNVWLPLEIAIVFVRTQSSDTPALLTRRAAGLLVAALELGAIAGALGAGQLDGVIPLQFVLLVPAVIVIACFFIIWLGIKESPDAVERRARAGRFDTAGLVFISLALLGLTGGLSFLRLGGVGSPLAWILIVIGIALIVPFALVELRQKDPLIDVRMFASPSLWPVFVTAGLFGVSVLGAQAPLSTFARTDAATYGYGLSASSFQTSILVGTYVLSLVVGAMLLPVVTRAVTPRVALMGASLLVAVGYLLFVPFHAGYAQVLTNMIIAGIGSGALVAALPAAAAAAAPLTQTGVATGLTNSVKTVGGAIASAVFGIALLSHAAGGPADSTAGSFSGYMTVWIICGVTAVACAIVLFFVPKHAFSDAPAQNAVPVG